ncbi:hypothetical protein SARC_10636 [Sphaeroforma arctica JP610]|uniref:F-box domain-containing protein n=1 Tax=Sphaeroforma arctica JP610 TaxID=667725 RepID=A0A0L0FJB6_9EUKA|nr:hypothetical protein SARC_10636 [Sphaeroforma arctica JP610]KNC76884.1 hypothetical protein SARC_10636 [Sphaeroforma arctica JP610]|eukprot:XP_014150786.1 hypothetical protein SARC_10636 [Sphaeroforma arctica JP610]
MQTYGIDVPLVSKTLLSLDVHAVMVADAFKDCPNLTTLVFLLTHERLKTEDVSSASIKHLSYHNWGGMKEVSASLFPKVETYQTKVLTMPFHSMTLKELALKSFTLPANSQHPNLKHLSVSLGEGEDLQNFSGNWPTDLESLKISFGVDDDRIDEHFEEFLGSMLATQTRLTTLRIDAVLHRPLSSASLTHVSVDGYYTLDILRQTLANCPKLEVICLGEGRSPIFWDNVAMWQSLKNIKVLAPYRCRKTMPPSFSEMMVEGRGGYWHRY